LAVNLLLGHFGAGIGRGKATDTSIVASIVYGDFYPLEHYPQDYLGQRVADNPRRSNPIARKRMWAMIPL